MSDGNKKTDYGQATIDALRRASVESSDRDERYEKIFAVERTKWAHDMGSKMRSDIPEKLQDELDECIAKSQKIARDACQTPELTEAYLKENNSLPI